MTKVVRTPLSGDLALAPEGSFYRVRAKFATKGAAAVTAVVPSALEARTTCLATGGVGAWWANIKFDLDPPIPVISSKAHTHVPNPGEPLFVYSQFSAAIRNFRGDC